MNPDPSLALCPFTAVHPPQPTGAPVRARGYRERMAKKHRPQERRAKKHRRREPEDKPRAEEATTEEGSGPVNISGTTAPSIGPNTVIEKDDPEERLSRHEQSETDAMGRDKRREVIGGRYSPSLGRQAAMYGIFLAVVAAITIGFIVLAGELDKPPNEYKDEAPWARADAPNIKPQPIDFPTYGNPGPDSQ